MNEVIAQAPTSSERLEVSQIPSHLSGGAWLLWAQFSKALRCAGGSLSVSRPARIPILQKSRSIPARKDAATEVDAGAGMAAEAITKMTSGRGVDTAIEAAGVPATFMLFEDIVAPGGTIAQVGVHGVKADLHLERLWSQNSKHAVRTAWAGYSVGLTCGGASPAALSSAMICRKQSMPYSVKGGYAILADAVDAKAAVFREHVDQEVVQPIFVLAEHVGDVADGEDGCDGRHDHAA
jgi:hypothetical protein